jgi:hypothetical protein
MANMSIGVEGLDKAISLATSVTGGPKAARRALRKWAERVVRDIKKDDVPMSLHGGTLRSTIHVEQDEEGVEIVAGGPAAPYAREVHEDFSWHRENVPGWPSKINWTKAGTGPKYLERPALEAMPGIIPAIWDEIAKAGK